MSGEESRRKSTVINAEPTPAEVDELLRAAQDDLLLNLSLDTHATSRRPTLPSSASSLDPDLSRRFDALRSHAAPKREPADAPSNLRDGAEGGSAPAGGTSTGGGGLSEGYDEVSKILGDDLAARFAALKGATAFHLPAGNVARKPAERIPVEDDSDESGDEDDGVSKEEVEKLMQWAMDAARLDPDPDPDPSNSDDEGKEEEGGVESEQDADDDAAASSADDKEEEKKKKKKAEGKKPSPPIKKWFFF